MPISEGHDIKGARSPWFVGYLVLTTVICGALVMVVEVLGSKVIGPYYGVSLFVWTSLISVTLIALALGYAAGGILSDRNGSPDCLFAVILISGLLVLLVPVAKIPVLKICRPLGLRAGALVSSALLFGPSLFSLGFVSPYVVKIAAREMSSIGKTVGVFYAVSTAGSFLGTLVTGFVLLAFFSVGRIFMFAGILLVSLSMLYFLCARRIWFFLGVLAVPLALLPSEPVRSKYLSSGVKATELLNRDTFYGNVRVIDYAFGPASTGAPVERDLLIDGQVQSAVDASNGMSLSVYYYLLEFLPYALNPSGRECLVIGLGAGIIPTWYEARGIRTDVVDINPHVVEAARTFFGFRNSGDVRIADARYFLNTTGKKYDFVILDVFNGDTTPGHVLTVEALNLVKARLTPEGILAINLIGSISEDTFITASVIRTLESVFRTVEIHPVPSVRKVKWGENLAVIAYDRPRLPFRPEIVKDFPVHPRAASAKRYMERTFRFPEGTRAIILTDEYNPADFFDTRLKENVRSLILENTDWDLET
jgi:spermidine synthase